MGLARCVTLVSVTRRHFRVMLIEMPVVLTCTDVDIIKQPKHV